MKCGVWCGVGMVVAVVSEFPLLGIGQARQGNLVWFRLSLRCARGCCCSMAPCQRRRRMPPRVSARSGPSCRHRALFPPPYCLQAPQNVINVCIPTVYDPSLAPPGKHLVHAYTGGRGVLVRLGVGPGLMG